LLSFLGFVVAVVVAVVVVVAGSVAIVCAYEREKFVFLDLVLIW
jgi:hypothetical protein